MVKGVIIVKQLNNTYILMNVRMTLWVRVILKLGQLCEAIALVGTTYDSMILHPYIHGITKTSLRQMVHLVCKRQVCESVSFVGMFYGQVSHCPILTRGYHLFSTRIKRMEMGNDFEDGKETSRFYIYMKMLLMPLF
jgi:hypothetical protein